MARPTKGRPVTITCEAWDKQEYVVARTIQTQADKQFIDGLTIKAGMKSDGTPDVSMDTTMMDTSLIAAMVLSWHLTQQVVNEHDLPLEDEHGYVMKPLDLPHDPYERLKVIEELHPDDVDHIAKAIRDAMSPPMSEPEKKGSGLPATPSSSESPASSQSLSSNGTSTASLEVVTSTYRPM